MVVTVTAPGGGDVTLPMVGKVSKTTAYVGIGGVLVVGGYAYYKKRQAAAAAALVAAPANSIDPATGQPFGSAADATALAAQANYQVAANAGGSSGATPQPTVQGFTNNSQWSQAAQEYLTQNTGGDPGLVGSALGKFLAGSVVTDAEKSIIQQAIAFEGLPPIAGATGFPPAIRDAPAIPTPPATIPVPAKSARRYTAVKGDTLAKVSQKEYGTTGRVQTLRAANRGLAHWAEGAIIPTGYGMTIPAV